MILVACFMGRRAESPHPLRLRSAQAPALSPHTEGVEQHPCSSRFIPVGECCATVSGIAGVERKGAESTSGLRPPPPAEDTCSTLQRYYAPPEPHAPSPHPLRVRSVQPPPTERNVFPMRFTSTSHTTSGTPHPLRLRSAQAPAPSPHREGVEQHPCNYGFNNCSSRNLMRQALTRFECAQCSLPPLKGMYSG